MLADPAAKECDVAASVQDARTHRLVAVQHRGRGGQTAIAKAHETVHHIQWFQVVDTRGHVTDGKIAHWQVTVKLGFTLD